MPAVLKNMQIYFVNFQIEDYSLVKFLPLDMSEEDKKLFCAFMINMKCNNRKLHIFFNKHFYLYDSLP
jgi:hypothetical protein